MLGMYVEGMGGGEGTGIGMQDFKKQEIVFF